MVRRRASPAVEDLNECVTVGSEIDAGYDRIGLATVRIDELEVPTLEVSTAASKAMVEVEVLGMPGISESRRYHCGSHVSAVPKFS
jgi:hypothetical protein